MWSKVVQDLFRQPTRMCFFVFVKIVSPGCPCDLFQVDDDNQVTITTDSLMVQSLCMHTSHLSSRCDDKTLCVHTCHACQTCHAPQEVCATLWVAGGTSYVCGGCGSCMTHLAGSTLKLCVAGLVGRRRNLALMPRSRCLLSPPELPACMCLSS